MGGGSKGYHSTMKKNIAVFGLAVLILSTPAWAFEDLLPVTPDQMSRAFELASAHESLPFKRQCNQDEEYTCVSELGTLKASCSAPTPSSNIQNIAFAALPQQFDLVAKLAAPIIFGASGKAKSQNTSQRQSQMISDLGLQILEALNTAFVRGLSNIEFGTVNVVLVHQPDTPGVLMEIMQNQK
jgi:hypothetical protein